MNKDIKMQETQTKPYFKERLQAGESYWWCSCGLSAKQPFCDGSHKGACELKPQSFTVDETRDYVLCGCKKTSKGPFCDGSHKN